jgi:hypothetical protein
MKITFSPDLPQGDEWNEIRNNIRNELTHFEGRFAQFPSHLIVRLEAIPFRATGVAEDTDGIPQVEITYDLLSPHTACYQYVGGYPPRQQDELNA